MTKSARSLFALSTMTDSQFRARYAISPTDHAATNACLDRIAVDDIMLNHDWLRGHGWRCGLWADYVAFLPEQVEHICTVAGNLGEAELWVGTFSQRDITIFKVPATDPVLLDHALAILGRIGVRIIPLNESFAIIHRWDEIVCYAAPPELMPALSLQGSAEAEKAHLDRFASEVYDRQFPGQLPNILAANDGFWWWQ